jgi:hypothetical protein
VTVQVVLEIPLAHPDHDEKRYPDTGDAVRVTRVFGAYSALQSLPQSIPPGEETRVPLVLTVVRRYELGGVDEEEQLRVIPQFVCSL